MPQKDYLSLDMPLTEILCISYFDRIIGPNTFHCNAELSDREEFPDLGRILDFNNEEGTFIFAFRKYQTVNHIFYLESEYARGGKDLLMISYMIRAAYFKSEISDIYRYLESKTPILEEFASELQQLEDFSRILNQNKDIENQQDLISLGNKSFQKKFINLFKSYFKTLCMKEGPFLQKSKDELKKVFIFGADHAGKTTFLKNIEALQFHSQDDSGLGTQILEVVIDNMEILMEECIDNQFKCEQCGRSNRCINKAQGFILIFNVSDKQSIIDAKERFKIIMKKICNHELEDTIPILIIGNKFTYHEEVSEEIVNDTFQIDQINECDVKIEYFPVNLLNNDKKTLEALRWFIRNII